MRRWTLALATLALTAGWAAAARAAERAFPAPEAKALEARLRAALEDPATLRRVRIEAEGAVSRDTAGLTLYGSGVGIWNRTTQFRVRPEVVRAAVRALVEARFTHMPEGLELGADSPVQIVRSLSVAVGDTSWTVVQRRKARERKELTALLDRLAGLCRRAAQQGLAPLGLEDALARLARGELAPEVLRLNANAPRVRGAEGPHPQGWRLEARHGEVTAWRQEPGRGWTRAARRPLTAGETRRLAGALAGARFWDLPASIHWPGYCHVSLEILGHRHAVLGRTFAGPMVERTREAAKRFAPLVRALRERYDAALESGRGRGPAGR
ncbi:MAG: hypothetical protein D6739_07250 [Nitrospirae bacterium]|nr:MAG: hypothetical protein D6739_07250 [Nitrospirota bacterium]